VREQFVMPSRRIQQELQMAKHVGHQTKTLQGQTYPHMPPRNQITFIKFDMIITQEMIWPILRKWIIAFLCACPELSRDKSNLASSLVLAVLKQTVSRKKNVETDPNEPMLAAFLFEVSFEVRLQIKEQTVLEKPHFALTNSMYFNALISPQCRG